MTDEIREEEVEEEPIAVTPTFIGEKDIDWCAILGTGAVAIFFYWIFKGD